MEESLAHQKLISIIVPTYNCCNYLEELILCVIKQTYDNWELIIIDDESTDETASMIKKYSSDKRIHYYVRPSYLKKGAQSCRNYGKEISKGEYICFFDSDDLISEKCLEQRISYIQETDVDYCIFPAATFTDKIKNTLNNCKFGVSTQENILKSFLECKYQFTVWTNIYKKDSIKDIKWDDNILLYQDFDFLLQCIFKKLNYSFYKTTYADYFYRIKHSDTSICSKKITDEKCKSTIYLFSKILNNLKKTDNYKEYKKAFLYFHNDYYFQIVKAQKHELEIIFLNHIKNIYGNIIYTKIKTISYLIKPFRKSRIYYPLQQGLLFIAFFNLHYLSNIKEALHSHFCLKKQEE